MNTPFSMEAHPPPPKHHLCPPALLPSGDSRLEEGLVHVMPGSSWGMCGKFEVPGNRADQPRVPESLG